MKWFGKLEDRRVQLKNDGFGPTAIAKMLTNEFNTRITVDMVNGRNRVVNKKNPIVNETNEVLTTTDENNYEQLKFFSEEDCEIANKYLYSNDIKRDMKEIYNMLNDGKTKKILSLSDLHSPYMDLKKIDKAIRDNLDCEYCVINGDLLDLEAMSAFDNMNEVNISEEFAQVDKLLSILDKTFKKTIIIGGNHDYTRFAKYIMKNVKPSLRSFAFDRLNPLKYITEKYMNIKVINHNTIQIGDVEFKHPNKYNSPEMRTIVNEYNNMIANLEDFPNPEINCIIIGHTHMAGEYYYNGVKLIEQGCLCKKMDYRFLEPSKRSWTTGYCVISLDDSYHVDFNETKFIYI